jgi:hypothetical protein
VRVEINAFCRATENAAVLDGVDNILVIEAAQVDGQLVKELDDFRWLVAGSSVGLAITGNGRGGVIVGVGELVATTVGACGRP